MGKVIQFEERAVATLRDRLGQAESARADLAAFARGHSGAVALMHDAVIAAMEAESFDGLIAVVTRDWPFLLGIDRAALVLSLQGQAFLIDRDGTSRIEPTLLARLQSGIGDVAMRTVDRGHCLFGAHAAAIRAEALISIPAIAPFPSGLLLLGQRVEAVSSSDEADQLLLFLGRALGAMLRRWAS